MRHSGKEIRESLLTVFGELRSQSRVGELFPSDIQSFGEQIEQIREWIEDAREYSIAYESIVAMLESFPFVLTGAAAIRLLEVGLLMGFKTEEAKDSLFDRRPRAGNANE